MPSLSRAPPSGSPSAGSPCPDPGSPARSPPHPTGIAPSGASPDADDRSGVVSRMSELNGAGGGGGRERGRGSSDSRRSASAHGPGWSSARACSTSSGRPPTSRRARARRRRVRQDHAGVAVAARRPRARRLADARRASTTIPRCCWPTSCACSTSSSRSSPARSSGWRRSSIDFTSVLVPRLERDGRRAGAPFVLVLDDAHRLRHAGLVAGAGARRPRADRVRSSCWCPRHEPELALGRMRADRRVHTVSSRALAMDRAETRRAVRGRRAVAPAPWSTSCGIAPRAGRSASTWRPSRSPMPTIRSRRRPSSRATTASSSTTCARSSSGAPAPHARLPAPGVDPRRAARAGVRRGARARRLRDGARRRGGVVPPPHPARPARRGVPHAPAAARHAAGRARTAGCRARSASCTAARPTGTRPPATSTARSSTCAPRATTTSSSG